MQATLTVLFTDAVASTEALARLGGLSAGRTAVFAADVPHAYRGAGRGPCELLMTVHLPVEGRNA